MSKVAIVLLSIHIAISIATLITTFKLVAKLNKATIETFGLSKYFFEYMNKLDFNYKTVISYISLIIFAVLPLINILDLVLQLTQADDYKATTIKDNEKTMKEICKKHNINYEASKKANNKSEIQELKAV